MFSWQARLIDCKVREPYYVEQDLDTGSYDIYGCESGHRYASYFLENDAEEDADLMNLKNQERREYR